MDDRPLKLFTLEYNFNTELSNCINLQYLQDIRIFISTPFKTLHRIGTYSFSETFWLALLLWLGIIVNLSILWMYSVLIFSPSNWKRDRCLAGGGFFRKFGNLGDFFGGESNMSEVVLGQSGLNNSIFKILTAALEGSKSWFKQLKNIQYNLIDGRQ